MAGALAVRPSSDSPSVRMSPYALVIGKSSACRSSPPAYAGSFTLACAWMLWILPFPWPIIMAALAFAFEQVGLVAVVTPPGPYPSTEGMAFGSELSRDWRRISGARLNKKRWISSNGRINLGRCL